MQDEDHPFLGIEQVSLFNQVFPLEVFVKVSSSVSVDTDVHHEEQLMHLQLKQGVYDLTQGKEMLPNSEIRGKWYCTCGRMNLQTWLCYSDNIVKTGGSGPFKYYNLMEGMHHSIVDSLGTVRTGICQYCSEGVYLCISAGIYPRLRYCRLPGYTARFFNDDGRVRAPRPEEGWLGVLLNGDIPISTEITRSSGNTRFTWESQLKPALQSVFWMQQHKSLYGNIGFGDQV